MPSAARRASGAAFTLRPGESITFVLPVTPRTKKNHGGGQTAMPWKRASSGSGSTRMGYANK